MSIGIYFLRVFKYLLKMAILLSIVFAILTTMSGTDLSFEQLKVNLLDQTRGGLFLFALLGVAFTYPKFGYAKRTIQLNLSNNRDAIIAVMAKTGYSLHREDAEVITFRASSVLKRILMLGDDKITINKGENSIVINGVRKDVSFAEYRLKSLVSREE